MGITANSVLNRQMEIETGRKPESLTSPGSFVPNTPSGFTTTKKLHYIVNSLLQDLETVLKLVTRYNR